MTDPSEIKINSINELLNKLGITQTIINLNELKKKI